MRYELVIVVLALAVAAPALAADDCLPAAWDHVKDNQNCYVFGNNAALEHNGAHRKTRLELVSDGEFCVDVVYVKGWDEEPTLVGFTDLELVDTFVGPDCEPAALVELTPENNATCEPGAYILQVDDSLGDEGQVLAILDGLVLLELGGELRYLLTDDAEVPACWRMIWHPPWKLAPPARSYSSPKSTGRRTPRNRRNRR